MAGSVVAILGGGSASGAAAEEIAGAIGAQRDVALGARRARDGRSRGRGGEQPEEGEGCSLGRQDHIEGAVVL